jgi:hypothetical protein
MKLPFRRKKSLLERVTHAMAKAVGLVVRAMKKTVIRAYRMERQSGKRLRKAEAS